MNNDLAKTWNTYTTSWKEPTEAGKRKLFEQSLASDCKYTDPLAATKGWDELLNYMRDFHRQIPGGYFETTYFLAHHNQSISRWQMKNSSGEAIGEGISYGVYDPSGRLTSMTGFFETPKQ